MTLNVAVVACVCVCEFIPGYVCVLCRERLFLLVPLPFPHEIACRTESVANFFLLPSLLIYLSISDCLFVAVQMCTDMNAYFISVTDRNPCFTTSVHCNIPTVVF